MQLIGDEAKCASVTSNGLMVVVLRSKYGRYLHRDLAVVRYVSKYASWRGLWRGLYVQKEQKLNGSFLMPPSWQDQTSLYLASKQPLSGTNSVRCYS